MLLSRASLAFLLSAAVVAAPAFADTTTTTHKKSSSAHSTTHTKSSAKAHKTSAKSSHHQKKLHGQQNIDSARATEIQKALIREHYMTGEANGQWDSTTLAAMQKFQADQGWQTKLMPDSRAIKKLGLGPITPMRSMPADRRSPNPSPPRRSPPRKHQVSQPPPAVNR